jgi:hypothetical protein
MLNVVTLILMLIFNLMLLNILSRFIDENGVSTNSAAVGLVSLFGVGSHTMYLTEFSSELAMWTRLLVAAVTLIWMFTFIVSLTETGMLGTWPRSKKSNTPQ